MSKEQFVEMLKDPLQAEAKQLEPLSGNGNLARRSSDRERAKARASTAEATHHPTQPATILQTIQQSEVLVFWV